MRRSSRIRKNSDSGSEVGLSDAEEGLHQQEANNDITTPLALMRGRRKKKVDVIELTDDEVLSPPSRGRPKKKREECSTEEEDVLLSILKQKKTTPCSSRKNLKAKVLPTVKEDRMLDTTEAMTTSHRRLRSKIDESEVEETDTTEAITTPHRRMRSKNDESDVDESEVASQLGSRKRRSLKKNMVDEMVVQNSKSKSKEAVVVQKSKSKEAVTHLASEKIKERCNLLYTKPDLPLANESKEEKKEENQNTPLRTKRKGRRKPNGSSVQVVDAGDVLLKYAEIKEANIAEREDVSEEIIHITDREDEVRLSGQSVEPTQECVEKTEFEVEVEGAIEINNVNQVAAKEDTMGENVQDEKTVKCEDQSAKPEIITNDTMGSKDEKEEDEGKSHDCKTMEAENKERTSPADKTKDVSEEGMVGDDMTSENSLVDIEENGIIKDGTDFKEAEVTRECEEKTEVEKKVGKSRENVKDEEMENLPEEMAEGEEIEQSRNKTKCSKNELDSSLENKAGEVYECGPVTKEVQETDFSNEVWEGEKKLGPLEKVVVANEGLEAINEKDQGKIELGEALQTTDVAVKPSEEAIGVEKEELPIMSEEAEKVNELLEVREEDSDSGSSDSNDSDSDGSDEDDTCKESENNFVPDQKSSLCQISQQLLPEQAEITSKPEKRKFVLDRSKYENGLLSNPLLKSVHQLKKNNLFQDLMKMKRTNTQENNSGDILSLDGVTMSSEIPDATSNKKFKLSSSIQTTLKRDVFVDAKTGKSGEVDVDSSVEQLMKKSVLKDDLEVNERAPKLFTSKHKTKLAAKKTADETAGKGWYNLPRTELTDKVKKDLQLIKMRNTLDLKHHYKRGDSKTLPKYFQMGTIVEGASEFYSARVPKKARKNTMVDELLADAEFRRKNKEKYVELRKKQMDGGKGHYKKKKNKGKKAWERT